MEVFADSQVLTLDDYKSQKGHVQELEALARALREGGPWPIPLEEQARAMRIAFAVEEQIRERD